MKMLRPATEDEMLLCFMQGEWQSARFHEDLRRALVMHHAHENLFLHGDPAHEDQNALRKQVMSTFRGYPDREVFRDMPQVTGWWLAALDAADLTRIRYIHDSYWIELSGGTSSPLDGAANALKGLEPFGVSNAPFFAGAEHLRGGGVFPPVILLTDETGHSVVLEGHLRMTVYAMLPERFAGTLAYVGMTDADALKRK